MRPRLGSRYENMNPELTNLLPEERISALRQLYFQRLAVVSVFVFAAVAVVHAVLLLPSFLYLRNQVTERTAALASLSATLAGTEEKEISARVQSLSEDSAYLARLASIPKASSAVAYRQKSAIPHRDQPGVAMKVAVRAA